jgi:hypothetical protein
MVALQQTAGASGQMEASGGDRNMSRWATNTSDGSDLTRKCSTNSSGSATIDTRRFSIGSGIVDALEEIRLSEQHLEEDADGSKGLKRSWSARDPIRAPRDEAEAKAKFEADRRDSSPGRTNPVKRAQSTRHPLSQQFQ